MLLASLTVHKREEMPKETKKKEKHELKTKQGKEAAKRETT